MNPVPASRVFLSPGFPGPLDRQPSIHDGVERQLPAGQWVSLKFRL